MSDRSGQSVAHDHNPYSDLPKQYKIVVLGDSNVGKTTFIYSSLKGEFNEEIEPTIGSSVTTIEYNYQGIDIHLNMYDTAGQEVYQSLSAFYIRGVDGALICFDPTQKSNANDYLDSIQRWISIVRDAEEKCFIILVAMKCDQWYHKYEISHALGENIRKKCQIDNFFIISSIEQQTFGPLFEEIAKKCIGIERSDDGTNNILLGNESNKSSSSSSCSCKT